MDDTNIQPVLDPLTERELQILRLIARGMSNREIAGELVITLGTVKWYNRQIYSKLGVHSRTKAVEKARRAGLLDAPPAEPESPTLTSKHNLPGQLNSFIGRERELADVNQLLSSTRLLTLTGPPGTGKTRLALQVAKYVFDRFPDGVFFVDLAPISDYQLFPITVAQVLGIRDVGELPLLETLNNYFRNKHVLLLLDNFEQIIDAAPPVGELLSASPGLKALITSREPLKIYGEQEYSVPTLALPDLDFVESILALSQYEAVELFIRRAQAVKSDFIITDDNASDIAEICVRLDGLPLAIELAAARSKLFSPEMMRRRLESRLGTLTVGLRDLPTRLRTLRGAIDWSYELLDESEKTLFARLAVFQGGRTIEAVEFVCSHDLKIDVLDGLESLLNKSLLRQVVGQDGEPRFIFLETIHEYAHERLEVSGEAEPMRDRHAEYFIALAERAEPELRGARESYWIANLRAENNNLRTALAWSIECAKAEQGLRLVGALRDFWFHEGHIVEGLRWIKSALECAGEAPPNLRAKALNGAGLLSFYYGDHDQGKKWNGEALAIYRELKDQVNIAWALVFLSAHSMANHEEYKEGIGLCEKGLALFRDWDVKPGLAQALTVLGELARLDGDYERAGVAYEECLVICRDIGTKRREAITLNNLAYIAQHQGDYKRAEALMIECLTLGLEIRSSYNFAIAMAVLAGPIASQGRPEWAAQLLGASEALLESMGVGLQPGDQFEVDGYLTDVRQQLDETTFEAAWEKGRAMSLEEATAYVFNKRAGE